MTNHQSSFASWHSGKGLNVIGGIFYDRRHILANPRKTNHGI